MTILEKIKIIARDVLNVDMEYITEDTRLKEDLGVTERMAYELYSKAQDIFPGLEANKREAQQLLTIGDIVKFVERKVGNN